MPTSIYDILSNLRVIKWRGISAPCLSTTWDMAQRQAERLYPYVDGASHDNTGRGPYSCKAELCFSNTIEGDLFPTRLEAWIANLEAGSLGKLVHPVLGEFDARVMTYSGTLDPNKDRSGIVLSVTWAESIPDPTQSPVFFLGAVPSATYGKGLDEAIAAIGTPSTTGAPTGTFAVPTSLGATSFEQGVNNINNHAVGSHSYEKECYRVAGICDNTAVQARAANTNRFWPVVDIAEALAWSLRDKAKASAGKRLRGTAVTIVQNDTTLDAFARSVSNRFEDVLALNIGHISSPQVKRGTSLTYYTSAA